MSAFDRFCARNVPKLLQDADAPPSGWTDSAFEWRELVTLARQAWRQKKALAFTELLAAGWSPEEAASGSLRGGAQLTMGGAVVRPEPMAPLALRQRALAVLQDAASLPAGAIDDLLVLACQTVAFEAGGGSSVGIERQIQAAELAIAEHKGREAQRQRQLAGDRVTVRCLYPFRGAAKVWAQGEQVITVEEFAALESWAEQMEAQARQHGWDAPLGHEGREWPPYQRVGQAAASAWETPVGAPALSP